MEKNEIVSILYVEDQAEVRLFLSKILSRHYSLVYLAENGKQGFEMYKEHKPDIVISDIKMPVMDGLSMASRIKEINPRAKIILTTAHNDMDYFLHSIDIGISQYILKPIDREKLYNALDTCVEQVMLEREIARKTRDLVESNKRLTIQERELRESLQKTIALKEIISKSEENFRQLAENIQDAFWLQAQNKILYANKAVAKVLEVSVDDFYDNPEIFPTLIHPEHKKWFGELLQKHIDEPGNELREEIKILTPQGNVKTVLYRDMHVQVSDQKKARRVIAVTDISRQKENELLQLELQIAEKTARIKQQFLSNMSHEMRTPMNGIIAMTEILIKTNLEEHQLDYAQTIKNSAETLLEMINDLLDVTELEQGKISIKYQPVDMQSLFSRIFEFFKPHTEEKRLYLKASYQNGFPAYLITDYQRITQVIKNLISNAIKFTHTGGIEVKFNHTKKDNHKYEIRIDVVDTGIGIDKAEQGKMFEIFTQQNETDSRSFQGLGLGLTICRKIAYLMDGHIELESTPEIGSRFSFIFPAEATEAISTSETQNPEILVNNLSANILYAEDKVVNQKVVRIILENLGCNVDIAENGIEVIEMYEKKPYDLILMDIQMPLMDGITATKELRKRHQQLCPVIGLSANALKADAEHYIHQGLDDYLAKPVTPEQLQQKIATWLNIKDDKSSAQTSQAEKKAVRTDMTEVPAEIPDLDFATFHTIEKQTHGDKAILSDLYNSFLEETETIIHEVEQAQKNREYHIINSSIHALKGLSITIGALGVHDIAYKMDILHKQGKNEESLLLFDQLQKRYNAVKNLLIEKIPLNRS